MHIVGPEPIIPFHTLFFTRLRMVVGRFFNFSDIFNAYIELKNNAVLSPADDSVITQHEAR